MRKFLLLIMGISLAASSIGAQERHRQQVSSNFGMTAPHDSADLPRSRAAVVLAERMPKQVPAPRLDLQEDGTYLIDGGWELRAADSREWLDAVVPGTVLTTLVAQGIYPDPYYGLNNLAIPDNLCRRDWWYRTQLPLIPELLFCKKLELLFNGVNYRADIWLNGEKLGRIDGAFIRGRFDISALAKEDNLLEIHIFPPANPGIPHEQSARTGRGPNGGVLCLDGPTFISSEGWDWVPGVRDRNIGLWQDVRLIASGGKAENEVVFVDGSAYRAKRIVAVRESIRHREPVKTRSPCRLYDAHIRDIMGYHLIELYLHLPLLRGSVMGSEYPVRYGLFPCAVSVPL